MTRVCSNKAVVSSLCVCDTRQLSLACVLSCVQPRGKVGGAVPLRAVCFVTLGTAVCERPFASTCTASGYFGPQA